MIPGIVATVVDATTGGGGPGGGDGQLGSPFASANIKGSVYMLGATSKTFSDFFDNPAAGFNTATVDGGGAYNTVGGGTQTRIKLVNDLAAAIVGATLPRTLYFEVLASTGSGTDYLNLFSGGDGNQMLVGMNKSGSALAVNVFDNEGPDSVSSSDATAGATAKVAVRISAVNYRLCAAGGTVQVGTMGSPTPFNAGTVVFAWNSTSAPKLEKFEIYGDLSDADIQTLTA